MPSGGSWTASQDTLTDVALVVDTTTPVTLAGGYEEVNVNQNVNLFMHRPLLVEISSMHQLVPCF